MRSVAAICAVLLASTGCALSHERSSPLPPEPDAHIDDDAAVLPDAFVLPDAPFDVDAGPNHCAENWLSLAWCPADPGAMLGQRCETEGLLCGVRCCEPAPALACTGGVWVRATPPDCRGVDCAAPNPCGTGFCARDQICVNPSSELPQPLRCVQAPFAANSCGEVPNGWLSSTDPRTCIACLCNATSPGSIEIGVTCNCCDL